MLYLGLLAAALVAPAPDPLAPCYGVRLNAWCCIVTPGTITGVTWAQHSLCITQQTWDQLGLFDACPYQLCPDGQIRWYKITLTSTSCTPCGDSVWIPHTSPMPSCTLPEGCSGNDDACLSGSCEDTECHDHATEPWRHCTNCTGLPCPQ